MRKLVLLFIISTLDTYSQQDSLLFKRNFIYTKPIVFSNDVMELNDLWASVGYDRLINQKNSVGICVEKIFNSYPSNAVFYGPGLNAKKTNGMRYNLEWKHYIKKRIYFSSNFLYQTTKTSSEESMIDNTLMFPVITLNEYYVKREAFSIIPKIGVCLKSKNKLFFIDFSVGIGLKYINSNTMNKVGILSLKKESYSGKYFEYGAIWTYHPALHLKFGFNL